VILALETGWTPDVLADMPAGFRRACHWALYARAIAGPDGLQEPQHPGRGASPQASTAYARAKVLIKQIRDNLYPEGD
jgi:hypothetical protein